MDKDKLHQIKQDTDGLRNINKLEDITASMVSKHVHAEQTFREHVAESLDRHVGESAKFWHDNVEQLSIIKLSMEQKIDVMFKKLDDNSHMTKEALGLARNVNETLHPLIEKLNNHEGRLDDLDIKKARIEGGLRVVFWVISSLAVVGSSIYYLYIQNIKNEIKSEIDAKYQGASVQAVEERPHSGIYKINIITK